MKQTLITFSLFVFLLSCSAPKYTYFFDTGKYLDFSRGKWILNRSKSNSDVFDAELYTIAKKQFGEILGDSLLEINDLRMSKLVPTKIKFELSREELLGLKESTDCDFLINIKGNIISNNAGSISVPSNDSNYYASNQASVSISIYDLNEGTLISSSQVLGKVINEGSHFDNSNYIPSVLTSSDNLMLTGAKKLIKKYEKYGKK